MVLLQPKPVALAQTPGGATGQVRPLFGPTERELARRMRLDLTLSTYGAADDNSHFGPESSALDDTLQASRFYEGAQLGLMFTRRRPRTTLTAQSASAVRYYPDLRHVVTARHGGGVGIAISPFRALDIQMSQGLTYSPYYQIGLNPFEVDSGATAISRDAGDYSVSREKVVVYTSAASASYRAGRRATIGAGYSHRYSDFFARSNYRTRTAGGGVTYRISPTVALRAGMATTTDTEAGRVPTFNHNLDLGVDYQRAFRFSRATSFAVSSGTSMISAEQQRRMQITGIARLAHRLSSRWALQVQYERGARTFEHMRPFFTSTLGGKVDGYLSRRVSAAWEPACTRGTEAVGEGRAYTACTSQVELRMALARQWAVYVQDFYYHYAFAPDIELPAGLAPRLSRHGLRFGLALWAPLIP